jgi:hypothetical protein
MAARDPPANLALVWLHHSREFISSDNAWLSTLIRIKKSVSFSAYDSIIVSFSLDFSLSCMHKSSRYVTLLPMSLSFESLSLFVDFTLPLITSAKRQELFSQALPLPDWLPPTLPSPAPQSSV